MDDDGRDPQWRPRFWLGVGFITWMTIATIIIIIRDVIL